MDLLENLDLLLSGSIIAAIAVIGFTIFLSDRKSSTSRIFLFFTLAAIFWNITNYLSVILSFNTIPEIFILFNLRFHFFFTILYCLGLFLLFLVFPKKDFSFPKIFKIILFPFLALFSIVTLFTPFVVVRISTFSSSGQVTDFEKGTGIVVFGLTVASLISSGLLVLLRKFRKTSEKLERNQIRLILYGFTLTFVLHIIFNLILPAFYDNSDFVKYGPIFVFPLVILTAYTILKHKLFNIKVAATALLVFALSIVTFLEIIYTDLSFANAPILILRISVFSLILIFGILLIKGVLREVSLREQLQEANAQQERLIHFITHQIKGFFTVSRNIFAEVLTGDYGELPPQVKPMIEKGLSSDTDGVRMVQDVLNAANIKTGKLKYDIKPLDLRLLVEKITASKRREAVAKKLDYQVDLGQGNFQIQGDSMQLEHALGNLIDNAIKYTPQGQVKVKLENLGNLVRYSVKDSGIGITQEDMANIFTEGGRGKNAQKVNVQSTGYGLYIAKQIVEAHHGQIRVKSEGEGKGSTFIIELPLT